MQQTSYLLSREAEEKVILATSRSRLQIGFYSLFLALS